MEEKQRILIVDDTPANIKILREILQPQYHINVAITGLDALKIAASVNKPDLILMDIMMPGMDGYEVCRRLKYNEQTKNIPVLFVTSKNQTEDEAFGLSLGAVDYITKPICPSIVLARINTHMSLHLHKENLEYLVEKRNRQLQAGYIDTIHRLTLAAEYKDVETGNHIKRVGYYTRIIAEAMGLDSQFCENIFYAAPMHDIGKVAIPDAILLKAGALTAAEFTIVKTHSEIGAKILEGSDSPYLEMAVDIARSHHERWNGTGYPQGLVGEAIPLSARIMSITDQYDALRSKRIYKPAFAHEQAVSIITKGDGRTLPEHFDPEVLHCFEKSLRSFDEIFSDQSDE